MRRLLEQSIILLLAILVGMARAGTQPMPDLSQYPIQEFAGRRDCGDGVEISRMDYDTPENAANPHWIASAWFKIVPESPLNAHPIVVGVYQEDGATFYLDFDRDQTADEVLSLREIETKYPTVCTVAFKATP